MATLSLPRNAALYGIATILCLIQIFHNPASIFAVIYMGLVTLLVWSLARWTKQAALSFQKVASSDGQDISHLMDALENLRKKYALLSTFVKIYVAVIIIALIAGVIAAIVGAFKA